MQLWRFFLVFLLLGILVIEESFADENITIDNFEEEFQLKINQTAILESDIILVKLLGVIDSRCPWYVDCVWDGNVTISVEVVKDEEKLGTFSIIYSRGNEDLAFQNFDGYSLEAKKIDPGPENDPEILDNIQQSDYIVTLVLSDVEKNRKVPSPRAQIANQILPGDVFCKEGLELILKSTDHSPACVKSQTAEKLIERGWGTQKYL